MEPIVVPRSEHPISRRLIDPDAVRVLYRIHRAGFHAYLVGGGVRDLLLDRHPKDFDISTDAHPQQVKRLFRNCRLIGRRFRLAHVHFGEKILEVSTFRKRSEPGEQDDTEDILIRSDNTFGTAEEDALRRDFTINGLFYDISTFSLIDYVGGLADLNERLIRTIGDPDIRFREDPVRMIRAVKFAARLDFGIEETTYDAILRQRQGILKSARPRVLEEIFRLLGGGAAVESFRLLHETGLLEILIPELAAHIEAHGGVDGTAEENPLWGWLAVLDKRKAAGVTVSNPLLLGALLAEMHAAGLRPPGAASSNGEGGESEPSEAGGRIPPEDALRPILADLVVPRRDTEKLLQVFRMQRRFTGQRSRRFSPRAFVTKSYFHDAFQFFEIGVEATGNNHEALARWQALAEQAPPRQLDGDGEPRRRRRRRRRRDGRDEEGGLAMENGQEWSEDSDEMLASRFDDEEMLPMDEGDDRPPANDADRDEEDDRRAGEEPEEDEDAREARLKAEMEAASPEERHGRRERGRAAPHASPDAATPRPTGHATGARGRSGRHGRGAAPYPARPEPSPATPPESPLPRRRDEDDDDDSQIKFLGWSDQPAILNPRAHVEEPVPNPYLKEHRAGRGGPRRGGPSGGAYHGGPNRGGERRGGGPGRHGEAQSGRGGRSNDRYGDRSTGGFSSRGELRGEPGRDYRPNPQRRPKPGNAPSGPGEGHRSRRSTRGGNRSNRPPGTGDFRGRDPQGGNTPPGDVRSGSGGYYSSGGGPGGQRPQNPRRRGRRRRTRG